jgi:uncharacterized protein YegL
VNNQPQAIPAVDRWLTTAMSSLGAALDDVLDLRAGLADAQLPGHSNSLVHAIGEVLDLDAGLGDIIGSPVRSTTHNTAHSVAMSGHSTMKQKCLPTYLVIDASSSMTPYQEAVNQMLEQLHRTLADHPRLSEFAHMSVIAFSSSAQLVTEMTDMQEIPCMPEVVCGGDTNYKAAFDLVRTRIDIDVPALDAQGKAVLRPAMFFFTDGQPTKPGWEVAFRKLIDPAWNLHPHVITYGFGDVESKVLSKVATVAAFHAEPGVRNDEALTQAINSLLNSLVVSSRAEEMQIPTVVEGYRMIPVEYMD